MLGAGSGASDGLEMADATREQVRIRRRHLAAPFSEPGGRLRAELDGARPLIRRV
jgi:hypothetical protein